MSLTLHSDMVSRKALAAVLLVPTLCVGTAAFDALRHRGNSWDVMRSVGAVPTQSVGTRGSTSHTAQESHATRDAVRGVAWIS